MVSGTAAPGPIPAVGAAGSSTAQVVVASATTMGDVAYQAEVEINDYPQHARWKVTNKDSINDITEISGSAVTTRGNFFAPGTTVGPGQRKLHLLIEGTTQQSVETAVFEIKRILMEATASALERAAQQGALPGRYTVV